MIFYVSSGIGDLGEILLLQQLCLLKNEKGEYYIYSHSPDYAVRAVHHRFSLGAERPTFKNAKSEITLRFDLTCSYLDMLLKDNGLWELPLQTLLAEIPGADFNVINKPNSENPPGSAMHYRKRDLLQGVHPKLLEYSIADLHGTGHILGGRLIYWLIAKICQRERKLFMAPAIRTNDVYAFFPKELLVPTGYLHIRVAAPQPPEQGWEPVPPTVWRYLDKTTQAELTAIARWTVEHPQNRIDVLLEGDRKKVKVFLKGLPLPF